MTSIVSPSCNEMGFIRPRHLVNKGLSVDRLIYQFFALLGLLQGIAAGIVVAAPVPIAADPTIQVVIDIWGDYRLIGICFLGSSAGTAVRLTFFPLPELRPLHGFALVQGLAAKATVSMGCGLVVSPMLLRYLEWHPDGTNLIFLSAVVAFLSEVTLSIGTRAYQVWVEKKANELTGNAKP